MTRFEENIRHAMRGDELDQPGIIEMAASNFRGRQRLTTLASVLAGLAMLAAMVFCALRFFNATEVRPMILFATLFLFLSGALAMLKLWFWLMMIRYSIVRELKRLELQCSALADDTSRA